MKNQIIQIVGAGLAVLLLSISPQEANAQNWVAVSAGQPAVPVTVVGYTTQQRGLFKQRTAAQPVVAIQPVGAIQPVVAPVATVKTVPVKVVEPVYRPKTNGWKAAKRTYVTPPPMAPTTPRYVVY